MNIYLGGMCISFVLYLVIGFIISRRVKDAKKLYTNCTAAVLRAKEVVLKTATKVQENAEDIYAEAKQINEDRAAKEEEVFDGEEVTEETTAEETETTEETAEA